MWRKTEEEGRWHITTNTITDMNNTGIRVSAVNINITNGMGTAAAGMSATSNTSTVAPAPMRVTPKRRFGPVTTVNTRPATATIPMAMSAGEYASMR